jgi:osmotically-inducible protein OsmY
MGRGIEMLRLGIVVVALAGGATLALGQTETLDQASKEAAKAAEEAEEARKAGEEAKRAGEKAVEEGEEATQEATEAAEQESKKATEQVEQAGEEGKQEVEKESEAAKRKLEEGTKGEAAASPDDMEDQLEATFTKDKQLRGSDIDVDVDSEGEATLSGTVPNEKARKRAVQLTKQTKGIRVVTDQLTVAAAETR